MIWIEIALMLWIVCHGGELAAALDWSRYDADATAENLYLALLLVAAVAIILIYEAAAKVMRDRKCLALSLARGWRTQMLLAFTRATLVWVILSGALTAFNRIESADMRILLFLILLSLFWLGLPMAYFQDVRWRIGWLAGEAVLIWLVTLPVVLGQSGKELWWLYAAMNKPIDTTRMVLILVAAASCVISLLVCRWQMVPKKPE